MSVWEGLVVISANRGERQLVQLIFQCDGCRRLSLVDGTRPTDPWGEAGLGEPILRKGTWLPQQLTRKEFPDVPQAIAGMGVEAHQCLEIGASRAAVALARAVVEATAKAKEITSGSLQKKIDELYEQRFIREHVRDAAHEVRFGGNEVAHGDLVAEPVDQATATEILGLMDEILEEVFQSPARVARMKRDRLDREQRRKTSEAATNSSGAGSSQTVDEVPF